MGMIFPGMDPYLEDDRLWPGVHSRMIVYLGDALQRLVRPRYIAAIEERVYREGPEREIGPDVWVRRTKAESAAPPHATMQPAVAVLDEETPLLVKAPPLEVHESYVTILDRTSGQKVVTVIEVVGPSNKYAGPGRTSYKEKQREVLRSRVHLVEIDLLRKGPHVLALAKSRVRRRAGDYDYLSCVNRAKGHRDLYELYPASLRRRLPRILIPLAGNDPDVTLEIQDVLTQTYELGSYRDRIDYSKPCVPRLRPEDQAWADELIRQTGATSNR
ncbi:MAG TPA: DUF4058 family protein [Isosphaeraceae bacterium]|nr:DUF4058 family protein [Isosphaeraceae bacterium]